MVMETADRAVRDHVAGLSALTCAQESHLVDLETIRVLRMRIRRHVVRLVVVVDERHLTAARDDDVFRVHGAVRDRDRRRVHGA